MKKRNQVRYIADLDWIKLKCKDTHRVTRIYNIICVYGLGLPVKTIAFGFPELSLNIHEYFLAFSLFLFARLIVRYSICLSFKSDTCFKLKSVHGRYSAIYTYTKYIFKKNVYSLFYHACSPSVFFNNASIKNLNFGICKYTY